MNLHRYFSLVLAALLLPLLSLQASTIVPPAFDSLVAQSDYVVQAVVKSVNSEWRTSPEGQRYIASRVELDVRAVIRGTPPTPLILDVVGGRVGTDTMAITDAPQFVVGEESVLFIHGNGRYISPLVAMTHGLYVVHRDKKSGQNTILRHNGEPLYDAQDVGLPLTELSAVKKRNPSAQPLTLEAFSQAIRNQPARSTTSANAN